MIEICEDKFCRALDAGPAVVTVGTFDGVHLGHRQIIERLKAPTAAGLLRTVVTFDPHPQSVTRSRGSAVPILTSTPEKLHLLCSCGVDRIVVLRFNAELALLSAEDFVQQILLKRLQARKLVIGYNHSFGRDRQGNVEFLERSKARFQLEIDVIPAHDLAGETISSTKIRQALENGEVERATGLLGRHYALNGVVISGHGVGKTLEFPTANLKPSHTQKLIPMSGVYAVAVELEGRAWAGMLNVGVRPTFGAGDLSIEVHLIGFAGDLYGKVINLHFLARLREEQRFANSEELRAQLQQDREASLRAFQQYSSNVV